MNIGIITAYHNNRNYGGQLQAYALQKTLHEIGVNAELVSFERKRISNILRRIRKLNFIQFFKRAIQKTEYSILVRSDQRYNERSNLFLKFETSIPHTITVSVDDIASISGKYDIIIVGSDNVWRPESAFDDAVFLNFALPHQYKMSYAASIGVTMLSESERKKFEYELRKFDAISVRERYSALILEELLGRSVHCGLDPTLLLSANAWESIECPISIGYEYVFEYFTDDNPVVKKRIYNFAREKKLKVVGIVHAQGRYHKSDTLYVDVPAIECGPREWLYLVHHAKYVFSDSFHCAIFSILYRKDFWIISKQKKDAPNGEGRQADLLSLLALDSRLTPDITSLSDADLTNSVQYEVPLQRLEVHRKESIDYLMNNIETAKRRVCPEDGNNK